MSPTTAPSHRSSGLLSPWLLAGGLTLLLACIVMLGLGWGTVPLSVGRIWNALWKSQDAKPEDIVILWDLRLPRTILAGIVGGALATAGAAFQGLFRNPLADPYVIGASSGAALGATLAVALGMSTTALGLGPLPLAAFLGTIAAVLVVFSIAETGGNSSVGSLLLAGSALSAILTAVVSFLLICQEQPWFHVFSWLLGGFSGRSWGHLAVATPYLIIGMVALWLCSRPLDALSGGDELAASLGLSLRKTRLLIVGAASFIVAASVAVSGIIGFIGLIAPHMARWLVGAGHKRLIPVSALLGAILLVVADVVARVVLAPMEVPVGIITSALGGPFFLYLLKRRGGQVL